MICEKCNSKLGYGDKFCNTCGEKIPASLYEDDYKDTAWGKFDNLSNKWDTFFLKKIFDSWVFKTLVVLAVLAVGLLEVYTDIINIKLLDSEAYKIEYNQNTDEYYVRTEQQSVDLLLYIPKHADRICSREYIGGEVSEERVMTYEEYSKEALKIAKDEFDYVTVSSLKGEQITDTVTVYLTE